VSGQVFIIIRCRAALPSLFGMDPVEQDLFTTLYDFHALRKFTVQRDFAVGFLSICFPPLLRYERLRAIFSPPRWSGWRHT
jgi:hypothetical protein